MAAHTLAQRVCRFSSSVISRASLVKPPIQVYGVEGRYATALYSAAGKHNELDQVERELAKVSDLIVDPKLSRIIADPFVKRNIKKQMLRGALAEAKLLPITANFIDVLAENGRLTLFGKIFAAFAKMMSAHRGEVLCSVTTARPLDEAGLKDLKVALKGFLQKGETIKLETKSDPSILGGMIVSVGDGDKYVDMSTRTKIQKLTKLIRET